MYQERYWKELYQLKVHVIYLELYLHDADFKDKAINIFLACTSSGSIAGWAIWREMAIVWALIIAASQVVTVIKNILPYKARIKAMLGLIHDLEDVLLRAEEKWFDVSEGRLTEEEINKLRFDIRTKKTNALKKHLGTSFVGRVEQRETRRHDPNDAVERVAKRRAPHGGGYMAIECIKYEGKYCPLYI